jgi:hypothetical protein
VLEPSIAIVERDATIESLIDLHFGSGEPEATGLRMYLQPAAIPLTTLSLLTMRSCVKQLMRSRLCGDGRQALAASRGVRAKRRL